MKKNKELKKRHEQEFSALPLKFAFGPKQFDEMMKEWQLDPEQDLDKICTVGYGGYIQIKDADNFIQTQRRHNKELKDAIAEDKTGGGFIYEMFYYELCNHEYGYTRNAESTLDALGYTYNDLLKDERLMCGFEKAINKIIREDNEQ